MPGKVQQWTKPEILGVLASILENGQKLGMQIGFDQSQPGVLWIAVHDAALQKEDDFTTIVYVEPQPDAAEGLHTAASEDGEM